MSVSGPPGQLSVKLLLLPQVTLPLDKELGGTPPPCLWVWRAQLASLARIAHGIPRLLFVFENRLLMLPLSQVSLPGSLYSLYHHDCRISDFLSFEKGLQVGRQWMRGASRHLGWEP